MVVSSIRTVVLYWGLDGNRVDNRPVHPNATCTVDRAANRDPSVAADVRAVAAAAAPWTVCPMGSRVVGVDGARPEMMDNQVVFALCFDGLVVCRSSRVLI